MNTSTHGHKPLHPLVWVAAVAMILFSAVGIGAFMGWIPSPMAETTDAAAVAAEPVAPPTPVAPPVAAAPAKTHSAPKQTVRKAPAATVSKCNSCGVIESVREVQTKGAGTGLGAVGGGLVGGLLGHQVGGGSGKDVMTVVGVVGGAMAGNEVEKRSRTTTSYSITVRYDDGSSGVFSEATQPAWRAGDKVKVVNGVIQSNN